MMKFLRSQSQTVLVIILIVIGASFLFYGNIGNVLTSGERGTGDYGSIRGQSISVAELYNVIRATRDSIIISGNGRQLSQPGAAAGLAQEAWRQLLLLHEADRLGVQVSDQELIDYIHNQPIFQKNGVYSPELYQSQMNTLQNALHISPDAFETEIRNTLRIDTVSKALLAPVHAPAQDVGVQYEKYYGPVQVSIVTFDPKNFMAQATVGPNDVAAEYKAHPDNPAYRTEEKRKVDYVFFPLSPEQMKLAPKDKSPALEALGEKALDFALALQPEPSAGTNSTPPPAPDFRAEATKRGLTVSTTDFFAADTPPTGLPPSPAFNNTAFALTKDDPVSKVVELDNGVAVLHLDEVQPSALRPLDEVKGDIAKQLQLNVANQNAKATADLDGVLLKSEVEKGASFAKAAAAFKLPVETLPFFAPAKVSPGDERLQAIAEAVTQLPVNGVSSAIPIAGNNTVVIAHLDTRAPPDFSGLAAFETRFRQGQDEQMRNAVYLDWADWMDRQPGTHKPPNLDEYGTVE